MEKNKLYRYIFDNLHKGKEHMPNYEWEFKEFYDEYSKIPDIDNTITQACKYHNTLESIKYFQKLVKEGGEPYDISVKNYIKKSYESKAEDIYEKKEIKKWFILNFLLYTAKIDLKDKDIGPLMTEIVNRNNLVETLHDVLNQVFNVFHFDKPEQLYALLQSCQQPYLN